LLAEPERRAHMGAAGRRYAEATFDIFEIGARFDAVLQNVKNLTATPRFAKN
jgi:hypothetical protein